MYLLDTNVVSELRKARAGKADHKDRWTVSAASPLPSPPAARGRRAALGCFLVARLP